MALGAVRVRRDVWKLAPWDPILEWYAKAVAEMLRRPIADPTSWRYQAAIHEYDPNDDPLAQSRETLPEDRKRFWNQCQHNSWFFLPWHRMYLTYFERIVAATVAKLGGPHDWALPYWNYSDSSNPDARRLRPEFYAERARAGEHNPLRVDARAPRCNSGDIIAGDPAVALRCLHEVDFEADPPGGSTGFGGPNTGFNHSGGRVGTLEGVPHGSLHVAVGGAGGWMSAFHTAALDPLFWLHHANIDRLWEVWLRRAPTHANPTDVAWLTSQRFEFNDGKGEIVALTPGQVVDTTLDPLRYRYEDDSDPLAGVPAGPSVGGGRMIMARDSLPEMVGATDRPVLLAAGRTIARLAISAPTGPAGRFTTTGAGPRQAYLNLENVRGEAARANYAVYLNVPADADPKEHADLFAGILPTFGVAEASRSSDRHGGGGLHYALDVTAIIERLKARGTWNPDSLQVTFVAGREEPGAPPIEVGRVSLYYK